MKGEHEGEGVRLSADLVRWSLVLVEAPAARVGTESLQESTRPAIVPASFQRQTDLGCASGIDCLVCCNTGLRLIMQDYSPGPARLAADGNRNKEECWEKGCFAPTSPQGQEGKTCFK